jgi:hypothetical protein
LVKLWPAEGSISLALVKTFAVDAEAASVTLVFSCKLQAIRKVWVYSLQFFLKDSIEPSIEKAIGREKRERKENSGVFLKEELIKL